MSQDNRIGPYTLIAILLVGTCLSIWYLRSLLTPFAIGWGLAYVSLPLQNRLRKFCPDVLAALTTTLFVLLVAIILSATVFPMMYKEITSVIKITSRALEKGEYLREIWPEIDVYIEHATSYLNKNAANLVKIIASRMVSSGLAVTHAISTLIFAPFITFFILKDYQTIISSIEKLIPNKHKDYVGALMKEVGVTISNCIRGQMLVCLCMGIYYSITLYFLGLTSYLAIGSFAGIMTFLPYIGYFSITVLVTLSVFGANVSLWHAFLILTAGGILESYVISPNFLSKYAKLSPLWVMLALMIGGYLMGFAGFIIAIPVAAVIRLLIKVCVDKYLQSEFYKTI